jgi:hypothetical protein
MEGIEEAGGAEGEEFDEDAGSEVMSIMSEIFEQLANLRLGLGG